MHSLLFLASQFKHAHMDVCRRTGVEMFNFHFYLVFNMNVVYNIFASFNEELKRCIYNNTKEYSEVLTVQEHMCMLHNTVMFWCITTPELM